VVNNPEGDPEGKDCTGRKKGGEDEKKEMKEENCKGAGFSLVV